MNGLAFIPGMQGGSEILVVILIVLLLFGAKKLPELARSVGKSLGEFKRGQQEGDESVLEEKKKRQEKLNSESANEPEESPKDTAEEEPKKDSAEE